MKAPSMMGVPLKDGTLFRIVVVALKYCVLTRFEIVFSINRLCQVLHHPTNAHWLALKKVKLHTLMEVVIIGCFHRKQIH